MLVSEFKEMITNIPNEYNDFEMIYAEVFDIESDRSVWARKDCPISGIISDSENNEMMLVSEETYQRLSKESE